MSDITKLLNVVGPGHLSFGGVRMALVDVAGGFWGLRRQIEAVVGSRLANNILQQTGVNAGADFARAFLLREGGKRDEEALRGCIAAYQTAGFGAFTIESMQWPLGRAVITAHDSFEAAHQHPTTSGDADAVCVYTTGILVGFANVIAERTDIVCVEVSCQAHGAEHCRFELTTVTTDSAAMGTIVSYDPDPFLSQQINLLEILFDRMPMGIAIFDDQLRLRRCNLTWANFVQQYTQTGIEAVVPDVHLKDLLPQSYDIMKALFERVLQGETIQEPALELINEGIVSYWDTVLTPLKVDGKRSGILDVTTDVTSQIQAERGLQRALDDLQAAYDLVEQRINERTRQLTTLLSVQQAITRRLDVQTVLQLVADEARRLTNTSLSAVYLLEGDTLRLVVLSSEHDIGVKIGERVPVATSLAGLSLETGQTYRVTNLPDDLQVFASVPGRAGVESLIIAPLIAESGALGVLGVGNKIDGLLTEEDERIMSMMTPGVVIALENARLYEQIEETAALAERNRLARDLHDAVTQTLFSASLTAEVLPRIWERDPVQGRQRLEKLRELTRGALAEMRTLLLELRPSALIETDLRDLLRQLAEAFTGRTRIPVTLDLMGERDIPPDVQVALYRIVQEALNNIAKHSGAKAAALMLDNTSHHLHLTISDDGCGFDTTSNQVMKLGLRIMAERADAIGADFNITSTLDDGTTITVIWIDEERKHDRD